MDIDQEIRAIVHAYEDTVRGVEQEALISTSRAYGGILRAGKGKLVESIAERSVRLAWESLGQPNQRLKLDRRKIRIPIRRDYLERIRQNEVREFLSAHLDDYWYGLSLDWHVHVDDTLAMCIECKAFTENAMLKRILVDCSLLRTVEPEAKFVLLQLESQLGGDYGQLRGVTYESPSTHTLLSYFDVDLNIVTLLEGERRIDRPIHKSGSFKPMREESVRRAIGLFADMLRRRA